MSRAAAREIMTSDTCCFTVNPYTAITTPAPLPVPPEELSRVHKTVKRVHTFCPPQLSGAP